MMKRIYHHHRKREELNSMMWKKAKPKEEKTMLKKAIAFTMDTELYGEWMLRVIKEWPLSCEHNLTDNNLNKQAWIGHAAACLAINSPEYITRLAWHYLTEQQQNDANEKADKAIKIWQNNYKQKESPQLCLKLD
jgi:hypothetical protein